MERFQKGVTLMELMIVVVISASWPRLRIPAIARR